MPTANKVQHDALVKLTQALPKIRELSRADSDGWTTRDRLHAQAILCYLDAYLTMLAYTGPDAAPAATGGFEDGE